SSAADTLRTAAMTGGGKSASSGAAQNTSMGSRSIILALSVIPEAGCFGLITSNGGQTAFRVPGGTFYRVPRSTHSIIAFRARFPSAVKFLFYKYQAPVENLLGWAASSVGGISTGWSRSSGGGFSLHSALQ